MRKWLVPVPSLLLLVAASGEGAAQGAGNPQCRLFTRAEAGAYVGAPVGTGESDFQPGASGCSWSDPGTGARMSVSLIPAGNALQLKAWGFESWEGFRAVPGIGAKAYVARRPIMEIMGTKTGGDWQAGAIVGKDYVVVALKGPKGNADAALALLRDTLERRQP